MLSGILAVSDENIFLILVVVRFLSLFFGDDNNYKASKYFEIANVLFFFNPALFRY